MNGIDLFERVKKVNTFAELLQSDADYKTQSVRGNLFEKMWDFIIKFGFNTILSNDEYDHYQGNINTCKLKNVDNLELYLQKLRIFSKGYIGNVERNQDKSVVA
jgi:hypothetical protein